MRRALPVGVVLLLAACRNEPDFDTRYEKASAEIEARAHALDADAAQGQSTVDAANMPKAESPDR